MIDSSALVAHGRALLAQAAESKTPYVANGATLRGMDCQGLIEYLLHQCNVSRNWKGSNDMWRNALKWAGTPEAFVERFQTSVPAGAGVFIVANDGGEPDEYKRTDGKNFGGSKANASHVGLYLGGGCTVHASSSNGCVCESSRFNGKRSVPNGGWNMIGLWADVDYGVEVEALLAGAEIASEGQNQPVLAPEDAGAGLSGDSSEGAIAAPLVRYARVFSADGGAVKLRPQPKKDKLWWLVANDVRVSVERSKDGWALIRALCTDGAMRRAWMMEDYLEYER